MNTIICVAATWLARRGMRDAPRMRSTLKNNTYKYLPQTRSNRVIQGYGAVDQAILGNYPIIIGAGAISHKLILSDCGAGT